VKERLGLQNFPCKGEVNRAYLKGSQQLAAAFDTGNVKKEVDGSGGDFWPVFSVSLNSIQDLLFVLVSTHLAWKNKRVRQEIMEENQHENGTLRVDLESQRIQLSSALLVGLGPR